MFQRLKSNDLATDNRGTTPIEYSLIASLIAIVIITGLAALGGSVTNLYTTLTGTITETMPDSPDT